jgi:hypothetical protein
MDVAVSGQDAEDEQDRRKATAGEPDVSEQKPGFEKVSIAVADNEHVGQVVTLVVDMSPLSDTDRARRLVALTKVCMKNPNVAERWGLMEASLGAGKVEFWIETKPCQLLWAMENLA